MISNYQKDTSITETPNPKWYGTTKPSLDKLTFQIITDQTQEPTALQNKEVNAIYPQPNQDLVDQVKKIQGVQYYLGKGLVWEHFEFNEKNQFLSDKVLRTAIYTAIDRQGDHRSHHRYVRQRRAAAEQPHLRAGPARVPGQRDRDQAGFR